MSPSFQNVPPALQRSISLQPAVVPVRRRSPAMLTAALAARLGQACQGSPRSFLIATVTTLVAGLAAMYALAWYVNPWGDFGPTGYHRTLANARLAKADYLDSLPHDALPDVFVMGSSNTMRYSPATIERHLGWKAFNFGVFWGRAEDFWCITAYLVKDLRHRPKLLILGTDPWTFRTPGTEHPVFPGIRRRLLNTPQLVRHHPEVNWVKLHWANFIDAFSSQQVDISLKLLRDPDVHRSTQLPLNRTPVLSIDGMRLEYGELFGDNRRENIFEDVEAGRYSLTATLQALIAENHIAELDRLIEIYDFEEFHPARIQHIERTLALCTEQEIPVVFTINPVHPLFYDLICERTPHLQNLARLRELLARFQHEYPIVLGVVDASHIDLFGGDPDGFYDPLHPATRNCDPIIARVAELVKAR